MTRRGVLTTALALMCGLVSPVSSVAAKLHKYRARIKTKGGSIIGTTVEARDEYEAVAKIKKRYPGCTILNLKPTDAR